MLMFKDGFTQPARLCWQIMASPLGRLLLLAGGNAADEALLLLELLPEGQEPQPPAGAVAQPTPLLAQAQAQLTAYFAGALKQFDLPVAPQGTVFQQLVWQTLAQIPYGQTVSYKQLAASVGCKSAQAVGQANARNPLPVIIPCHRVISADGGLGGYSGGLAVKQALLRLEAANAAPEKEG